MGECINPKEFEKEQAQANGFDPRPDYYSKSTVAKKPVFDAGWNHYIPKNAPPVIKNYLEKMLGMGLDVDAGRLSGVTTIMTGDSTSKWYKPGRWRSTPYDPDKYHGINPTDTLTPVFTAYTMWNDDDQCTDKLDYIDVDWAPWVNVNDINRQAEMRMNAHVAGTPPEWYPMCESMAIWDDVDGPAATRYYQPLPWFCQWYVNDANAEDSDINKYPNEEGVYAISWKREPSGKRWIHSYKIPEYPTEDGTYELVVTGGKPTWHKKT